MGAGLPASINDDYEQENLVNGSTSRLAKVSVDDFGPFTTPRTAPKLVQVRSGFGPTPSPIFPDFRRFATIECEKDTPMERCEKGC